ncbi:hypothetical protein KHO57_gp056 [Mycobacterium phage Phabba]|uniref:Uncharacterized protein n=1 Tax=Mycobacterium phage Phabba TaxID=2027899 RepID=A0A249XSC3_9CAUD|nr:hypothetical protein KHO57_gp056 [Mycobacterium phage Phabba]ASZ74631.1 hypothetical protein SEA_PHABBA_56 [Mycobacterium phage Phabba]
MGQFKEWDEPGKDFGKVYQRPARRIIPTHVDPQRSPAEALRKRIAEYDAYSGGVQAQIDANARNRAIFAQALFDRFGEEA